METGCGLTYPLLGQQLYQFIYPVFCQNASECGDTSPGGQSLECCAESGYCAAVSAIDGSSRCQEVTDLWTAPYGDYYEYEEYEYEDDLGNYIDECVENRTRVCVACAANCDDIGGYDLGWEYSEDDEESAAVDTSGEGVPPGLRSLVINNIGARKAVGSRVGGAKEKGKKAAKKGKKAKKGGKKGKKGSKLKKGKKQQAVEAAR